MNKKFKRKAALFSILGLFSLVANAEYMVKIPLEQGQSGNLPNKSILISPNQVNQNSNPDGSTPEDENLEGENLEGEETERFCQYDGGSNWMEGEESGVNLPFYIRYDNGPGYRSPDEAAQYGITRGVFIEEHPGYGKYYEACGPYPATPTPFVENF